MKALIYSFLQHSLLCHCSFTLNLFGRFTDSERPGASGSSRQEHLGRQHWVSLNPRRGEAPDPHAVRDSVPRNNLFWSDCSPYTPVSYDRTNNCGTFALGEIDQDWRQVLSHWILPASPRVALSVPARFRVEKTEIPGSTLVVQSLTHLSPEDF